MNRQDALAIVQEYVKNKNLINHMLCVEAAMRFYAEKLNQTLVGPSSDPRQGSETSGFGNLRVQKPQDVELWGMTGLLHDFDWEIHPTLAEHPMAGLPILRQRGVPEEIVHAILTHADHTETPRVTPMEKALFACDEVTGLITAVALVRPSRSLYDLTSPSVKKKWKDRAFAAGANREEIAVAASAFGLELWQHVDNVILAMRRIAPQIGLEGNLSPA
jgi:predicted hydrolase (HD superfamily)